MARSYTDSWSTAITATSSPYYITSGSATSATVVGGYLKMKAQARPQVEFSFTRGTATASTVSDPLACQGNFAMKFTVDMSSLETYYTGFSTHSLTAGSTELFPWIVRVSSTSVRLMWTALPAWSGTQYNNASGAAGDFTSGKTVNEVGVWTMIVLRKEAASGSSYAKLLAKTPTGVIYRTGWFAQSSSTNHQTIGVYSDFWASGGNLTSVGAITTFDQLSLDQLASIDDAGDLDISPTPKVDNGTGTYFAPTTATLSAPSDLDVSYTAIRYTTDGTEPTASSTVYTGPISIGSPYTPGSTVTLKCAYFSDTLGKARTKSIVYTFKVAEPRPSFIPEGQQHCYASIDVPILWTSAPDTNTEYWYTMDGTDPQTSGTAVKWVSGAIYAFNSHPDATVWGWGNNQGSYGNKLNVRAKHIPSGVWSEMNKTWTIYFQLTETGYTTLSSTGGYNKDYTFNWGLYNDTGAVVAYPCTTTIVIAGVSSTTTDKEGSFVIPFGQAESVVVQIYSTCPTQQLATYSSSMTATFGQYAPAMSKKLVVSNGESETITVTNLNPSSTLYYTLDGSDPTTNSLSTVASSTPVTVPNGAILKAMAARMGFMSNSSLAEVLREFEVGDSVTASEGTDSYHCYSVTQRCELVSTLGKTAATATVSSNVSSDTVTATIDGASASFYLWDVSDKYGVRNTAITKMNLTDTGTKLWSRVSFLDAQATLDYNYSDSVWRDQLTGSLKMFRVSAVSETSRIIFDYTIDRATRATTISKSYVKHDGTGAIAAVDTNGAVLVSGSGKNASLALQINNTFMSLSDGTGTSVFNVPAGDSGSTWAIEVYVNPDQVDIASASIGGLFDVSPEFAASLTVTSAAGGYVRRAPATVFAQAIQGFEASSKTLAFNNKDSIASLDFYVPCGPLKSHANVGYSAQDGAGVVDGPFEWKLPGVLDASLPFDVSVDFNARMERHAGQDITLYLSTEGYNGSATGIDIGSNFATLRCVKDSDINGVEIAGSSALELYAGSTATKIMAPTAQSRFKLRLVRAAGSTDVVAYGYVGATEVMLGSVTAPTGMIEARLVRKGHLNRPAPMRTVIFSAQVSGTLRTKSIVSAELSSATVIRKGVLKVIPATPIAVTSNTVKCLVFNESTSTVTLKDLDFEPSDGNLIIGVLDTRNKEAVWTNLLFSKTVRIRKETAGSLGVGYIVGAGSKIDVENGNITWSSSGYKQGLKIGTLDWVRPNVYVDLFRKKQVIKTFERQPIKVTMNVGPTA